MPTLTMAQDIGIELYVTKSNIEMRNFNVVKVKNGYILSFNAQPYCVNDEQYVFKTRGQLADFVENYEDVNIPEPAEGSKCLIE